MARRRVTYLEVVDERPGAAGARTLLELGPRPPPAPRDRIPQRRERPACPAWLAQLAIVSLVAAGALLAHLTTGPGDGPSAERVRERRQPVEVAERAGPVVIPTRSIIGDPWGGVFEHHPDARGADPVDRVHVVVLAGPAGRGLLVVDATRRAFGGPEHPTDRVRDARSLGSDRGAGLRTLQWDEDGFGLSLTTVGLTAAGQRAVAGSVQLPDGASLQHGLPPTLDATVLSDLGLAVVDVEGGAASAFGSPLIGQGGGASIEGQLHRGGTEALLVSVVQDQLVGAGRLRLALGPTVAVDPGALPGVTAAAALDHGPAQGSDRRIRGWARLVLDHAEGVTIELSSDVLRPAELLEAARAMDLARLVRTAAPLVDRRG